MAIGQANPILSTWEISYHPILTFPTRDLWNEKSNSSRAPGAKSWRKFKYSVAMGAWAAYSITRSTMHYTVGSYSYITARIPATRGFHRVEDRDVEGSLA